MLFRAIRDLASAGHDVSIYVPACAEFSSSQQIKEFVERHFFPTDARFILGTDSIRRCDALVATHWTTAYIASQHRAQAKHVFYFVQDYEPAFYPMGDEYLRAENTYRLGFKCITAGPWCTKILRDRFRADADFFQMPIDRSIYIPGEAQPGPNRILFFARPDMPRRCFPLGIEALRLVAERYPEVEICLFGSTSVSPSWVPFKHTDVGILAPSDLAEIYRQSTVGIAFSTTNPSMVPFEMMACGLPVVDLDHEENVINYGSHDNVTLAAPTAESIASAVHSLLENKGLRSTKSSNGVAFVADFPDEQAMADRIEELLTGEFRKETSS